MKRIKDLKDIDRPREKLIAKGAQSLSEFELLEVIIGSGNAQATVEKLAAKVQKLINNDFDALSYEKLVNIKGLSDAKITKILASVELAKRYVISNDRQLTSVDDFINSLGDIRTKQQEYLICLSLDGAQRLIARRVITVGTIDSVPVHPREVFAGAITDRAASIVIGHNHPSGEVEPSQFDIHFNQQLLATGNIVGVVLLDHIIVSKRGSYSFKENGLI